MEVARALVQEPSVVLFDEPVPGLEDDGVELLLAAVRRAAQGGACVLLVDHNVGVVERVVDDVVLLARGEVAFHGSMAECLTSEAFRREYVGGRHP